ncbi:hypothetical protein Nepgr_004528 [Nepenthes gracilis]|uniref:F-box domain-containing protein n=1 Tax=Nepenthes gracilis TaxID=150966 RepID=A0AAD3S1K0_NEPGR|nr:hypothetical protein Nepgr_004528 [Nepenthes gracilis]
MVDDGHSMANKRPCCFPIAGSPQPRSLPPSFQLDMDFLLEIFLELPISSLSLDLSFEKLLESRALDSDQNVLIDRALLLGSLLLEAGKRCARKIASKRNSCVWALPPDLTVKVFSILDTRSLCNVAATCRMFHRCAEDPLCYADIDLRTITPKVNNAIVSTMVQRAGQVLRSLKLGIVPGPSTSYGPSQPLVFPIHSSVDASGFSWNDKRSRQGKYSSVLTRSCLNSLLGDNGSAAGLLLKRLHLHNIDRMDNPALCAALSACPNLIDLEIVGLHVELRQLLESVSTNCHLLERLFFESSKAGRDDSLKSPACVDFINSCPYLTSLSLRGFKLHDYKAGILVKGFCKLKDVDFSASYSMTGAFLRNIGNSSSSNVLEVLILRDCIHLKEVEVGRFLTAVLAGDFKFIRQIDISNREGLASEDYWYERCYNPSAFPLKQLSEERPDVHLIAEFPSEVSFLEIERMIDSDANTDDSLQSQLSSHSSDSLFVSSTESSYNNDQGSGDEDDRFADHVIYEEIL